MCLCYCVLGFAAHSNISGDDSDCEESGCNYDRYDFMGYGTDLEEWAERVFRLVPRHYIMPTLFFERCCEDFIYSILSDTYFLLYSFCEILSISHWAPMSAWFYVIVQTYFTTCYIYVQSAHGSSF